MGNPRRTAREEVRPRTYVPSVTSIIGGAVRGALGKPGKKSKRKPYMHSRSFAPAAVFAYEALIDDDVEEMLADAEEFFDEPIPTSSRVEVSGKLRSRPAVKKSDYMKIKEMEKEPLVTDNKANKSKQKWVLSSRRQREREAKKQKRVQRQEIAPTESHSGARPDATDGDEDDDDDTFLDDLKEFVNNSERSKTGFSLIGKIFNVDEVMEYRDKKPKRRFFTWWVTVIQLIIFIVSIATYGVAPIGLSNVDVTGEVLMTNLAIERVSYKEQGNMWIGPREDDLIHLGARFSPCMRKDINVEKVLNCDKDNEKQTACCINNDGSGCVQTQENGCSQSISTWFNWTTANPGYQGRTSGSVCGQDPKYCNNPASTGAFVWEDDITNWPVCTEPIQAVGNALEDIHMTCEVIGRPCCVGIQGECMMATREYCEFRRGYFHENASLCSQVNCFEEVCGLFPFGDPTIPDQFYRLFFSQFLHAGVVSMVITILFQLLVMRDLESLIGWWQMAFIYIGGGVAGSLASAIFLPYHVEAGPSGSQFAVLAALTVEMVRWSRDKPLKMMLKIIIMLLILFVIGLLPGIDNYSHLCGFFYGLFIYFTFRPFKRFRGKSINKIPRVIIGIVTFFLAALIMTVLVLFFYIYPIYECPYCSYFNCIPFTPDFCESMQVTIQRTESQCQA